MSDLDGKCFIKRTIRGIKCFVPADVHAEEWADDVPEGREVILTSREPRHPEHHRWFFALLAKVVDNSEDWDDKDELLDALKFATKHTRRCMKLDGTMYETPRSINWASMGEDAFRRWKNRALYILGKFLGVDPVTLMKEVDETQRRAA